MNIGELRQKQSLPLEAKIIMSQERIRQWYEYWEGNVYVGFSGGKDSTVLLHLVRELYPEVPAVFVDTGLEYPEIREFVKTIDNVTWIKPQMSFLQVIQKYGYPVVSKKVARMIYELQNPSDVNVATRNLFLTGIKRDGTTTKCFKLPKKWHKLIEAPFKVSNKCCDEIKHKPFQKYVKETKRKAFIGTMASDSLQRESTYLKTGCNNYKGKKSAPLGFWLEEDIWNYLKNNNIPYCSIYDTGISRTGCMFCMFGVHLEKEPNRFQQMKITHPQIYDYCINKLNLKQVLDYINVKY